MPHETNDAAPSTHAAAAEPSRSASAATYADVLGTVACVWLGLITFGFAAFRFLRPALPTGASRNADRTFFTSVNAVTSTGFEQSFASVRDYPTEGKMLLATLALGGAIATVGGAFYFLRAIVGRTANARATAAVVFLAVLAPALLGTLASGFDGLYAAARLGLGSQYGGLSASARAWLVALAVPATLGPAAWLAWRSADRLLRATVATAAVLYLVSTLLLAATAFGGANGVVQSLNIGSMLSVNASVGTGLAEAWPAEARGGATPWALLLLMAIGTVPGGLGGGIGLLPLVLLGRRAVAAFRPTTSIDPRESSLLGVAILSIFAWVALVAGVMLALAATQPAMPGDRLLLIVVSAASNVGLSHDPIGLTGGGLVLLSAAMLLGRLLPVATLCVMAVVVDRDRERRFDDLATTV